MEKKRKKKKLSKPCLSPSLSFQPARPISPLGPKRLPPAHLPFSLLSFSFSSPARSLPSAHRPIRPLASSQARTQALLQPSFSRTAHKCPAAQLPLLSLSHSLPTGPACQLRPLPPTPPLPESTAAPPPAIASIPRAPPFFNPSHQGAVITLPYSHPSIPFSYPPPSSAPP
jgi:hypothetical protein